MSNFTCINCSVKFRDADLQRDHYKGDWHRYNLKRRVAELPPVTAEEFQKRILQQRNAEKEESEAKTFYCTTCRKHFNTKSTFQNHLNSKKHRESLENKNSEDVEKITVDLQKNAVIDNQSNCVEIEDADIEEVDSDEWDDDTENPITKNKCMFCDYQSTDLVSNLKHLSVSHSFFIPDIEYCVDILDLLTYLGEKVCRDFICLWCNDRGKTFYSLDAVRKHMIDKGHCKMLHEGIALAEYAEFYDYSSSYPDHQEGMDIDADLDTDSTTPTQILDSDDYQLVLPSGLVVGHRSLMRYYKQRLNPNRALVPAKTNKKLHKVLAEYRSLGWTATQQEAAARKARDIHFLKRRMSRWQMMVGIKANKLQRHFRQQTNY